MSLLALSLFLVATLGAFALRLRRLGRACAGLAVASFWLGGSGLPAALILDRVQMSERLTEAPWGARNVIVLLGWGIVEWPSGTVTTDVLGMSRVQETAKQYFDCRKKAKVCRVVVSGGDPLHHGRSEAEAMAEDLRRLDVPAADLILEAQSNNTFQNARFSSPLIARGEFDFAVLVTSGFHLRRSLLYFAHFTDRSFVPAPADHFPARFDVIPQALNFAKLDLALTEALGLLRYRVYNVMGWNPPKHL